MPSQQINAHDVSYREHREEAPALPQAAEISADFHQILQIGKEGLLAKLKTTLQIFASVPYPREGDEKERYLELADLEEAIQQQLFERTRATAGEVDAVYQETFPGWGC